MGKCFIILPTKIKFKIWVTFLKIFLKFGVYVCFNNTLDVQNLGHVGSKMGSWGQIIEILFLCLVNTLPATFFVQTTRNERNGRRNFRG